MYKCIEKTIIFVSAARFSKNIYGVSKEGLIIGKSDDLRFLFLNLLEVDLTF
jgi:hypothetical protein